MDYYEWDDVLWDYVWTSEQIGSHNNWDLSFFSAFNSASPPDSGGGVYETQQIVYEDNVFFDWYVDYVRFQAIDDDVYVSN